MFLEQIIQKQVCKGRMNFYTEDINQKNDMVILEYGDPTTISGWR